MIIGIFIALAVFLVAFLLAYRGVGEIQREERKRATQWRDYRYYDAKYKRRHHDRF